MKMSFLTMTMILDNRTVHDNFGRFGVPLGYPTARKPEQLKAVRGMGTRLWFTGNH